MNSVSRAGSTVSPAEVGCVYNAHAGFILLLPLALSSLIYFFASCSLTRRPGHPPSHR